nr:PucR family transcriptional regulator [Quadrisphaera sp. RL12-1S]
MQAPGLGLDLLVAGDLALPVLGAHTIEIDGVGNWLERGWVMLTTGMRFTDGRASSHSFGELVAELTACRAPALLFGVGVHFDRVPEELLTAARTSGLTVAAVRADVPFWTIESYVSRALDRRDSLLARQELELQNGLLETLAGDDPVRALVHRLGLLIRGTAVLYEESGRVVASTGEGPAMLIWNEIKDARPAQFRVVVGRWHVVARPTVLRGVGYWIALGSRRAEVLDELAEPVLEATQRLLGAVRGVRSLSTAQAVAESSEILSLLRAGITPEASTRLWDRLRSYRFQRGRPLRCFLATALPQPTQTQPGLQGGSPADEILQVAQEYGLPLAFDQHNEHGQQSQISGMVGEEIGVDPWTSTVLQNFHMGVSEPFVDLHQARAHFRDAERALRVAVRRAGYRGLTKGAMEQPARSAGLLVRFEDADIINWLLSSRSPDAVATKTNQQFSQLLAHEDLVVTLVAYFTRGMDITATADELFMHPNSVRYRLRRIEKIIEAPLASAAVIANLYVALHDRISRAEQ